MTGTVLATPGLSTRWSDPVARSTSMTSSLAKMCIGLSDRIANSIIDIRRYLEHVVEMTRSS